MKTGFISVFLAMGFLVPVSMHAQEESPPATRKKRAFLYKEYHNGITIEKPVGDWNSLKVISKAGNATFYQSQDDIIRVEADVVISSLSTRLQERFLRKYLNLHFEEEADRLVFRGGFSDQKTNGFHGFAYALRHLGTPGTKINLTMYVPQNLYLSITDGSGDLNVKDMCNGINITDGAGSIDIETVSGRVEVRDGSGDIRIKNVMSIGELKVKDGSGDIFGKNIYGSIDIRDGSGSIYLKDVNGLVDINDGSGDIRAVVSDGRVNVNSDGSGSKHISYHTGY